MGPKNIVVSRIVKDSIPQKSHEIGDVMLGTVGETATPIAMTTHDVEKALENEPELCLVRQCLFNHQRIEFTQHLSIRGVLCLIQK